jgi:dsRNA-specific ribonuclease
LEAALAFVSNVVLPAAMKYATEEFVFQPVVELQNLLQAHGHGHPTYTRVPAPSTSTVFQMKLFVQEKVGVARWRRLLTETD